MFFTTQKREVALPGERVSEPSSHPPLVLACNCSLPWSPLGSEDRLPALKSLCQSLLTVQPQAKNSSLCCLRLLIRTMWIIVAPSRKSLEITHRKGLVQSGHTAGPQGAAMLLHLPVKPREREGPRVSCYLNPSLWLSLRWQVPPCWQGFWMQVLMGVVQSLP